MNYKIKENSGEKLIAEVDKEIKKEKKGLDDEITATLEDYHSSKVGISIISNPIFNPKNGFEFAPKEMGKTSLVDGASKKIDLIIDQSLYDEKDRKLTINNNHKGIKCEGNFNLPIKKNLEELKIKNIIKRPFEIRTKNVGKRKEKKGEIKAFYKDKETEIKIKIIPPGGINFKGIKFDKSDTKEITHYKEDGYVYIYENHPLVKKYMYGDWKKKKDCLTFLADITSREFIEKLIRDSIKSGSSKFQIIDQDNPELEIKKHFIEEYHKNAIKVHNIIISYLRTAIKK